VRSCTLLEKIAAHCCDRIITVSHFHRSWAIALGIASESKIVAIPNGIPPERVRVVVNPTSVRASLGAGPDDYVILSIGRLAPQKGLEDLLRAVPVLDAQLGRRFVVWLVGEGELERRLHAMAGEVGLSGRIRFLGFRNDIGDLLAASDLVALPTLREGLSIALLEAMAAAKPVITTTIGSNREVTGDGASALLVPPGNTAALAAGICRLAGNPDLAARFAHEARRRFLAQYTLDRMLARYAGEYDLLLGKVHRRDGEFVLAEPSPPVARE
jgi:glycosyltransferase involved in cell wall biosynthesis